MGEVREKARNVWFETEFLPSFEEKMQNPEYPNQAILSERQAEICHKYMDETDCRSDNGKWFVTYKKQIGGTVWYVHTAGRYTFLKRHFEPYRGHHGLNGRVRCRRLDRREDIEYFGRENYFKAIGGVMV
jgi:hypothetical protein